MSLLPVKKSSPFGYSYTINTGNWKQLAYDDEFGFIQVTSTQDVTLLFNGSASWVLPANATQILSRQDAQITSVRITNASGSTATVKILCSAPTAPTATSS
jgi:hypothetical protein